MSATNSRVLRGRVAVVAGHSMRPTIPLGSQVLIEDVAAAELAPGDIVVWNADAETGSAERLIVHRLIRFADSDALSTQGDGCAMPDEPWSAGAAIGRVVAWRAGSGSVGVWRIERRLVQAALLATMRLGMPRVALRLRRVLGLVAWRALPAGNVVEAQSPIAVAPPAVPSDAPPNSGPAGESPSAPSIQNLGDDCAVYDPASGSMHLLNRSASLIWKHRSEGLSDAEIVEKLHAQFPDVSLATLAEDVKKIETELLPKPPVG